MKKSETNKKEKQTEVQLVQKVRKLTAEGYKRRYLKLTNPKKK